MKKLNLLIWSSLSIALVILPDATAATTSPLFGRGYTVLPVPHNVRLGPKDIDVDAGWRLERGAGIQPDDVAVQSLKDLLEERFALALSGSGPAVPAIRLAIAPDTVKVEQGTDRGKDALARQAYRVDISSSGVTVTGNTAIGLFYGVQTLVQLLKRSDGKLWLPEGTIEDWPDLELRIIYWDDAHHLERPDVLKAALRQASFYKVNGFAIKLEGHFQYQHAQPIVEPYALSPAELQDLTNYGLKYHVQLIPYLDGPAHDAFILKHPEYAGLREYADNNYEFCTTNPATYDLLNGLFDDLLAANKGVNYFVLSTDEPYYVGLANNSQCREAERARQLGTPGKLLSEFITKTAGYLHERGRTVIFWGEYPLKPGDIATLPRFLINGELYGPQFDPVFRAHGIRQMVYTWMTGEEQMFPQYYVLPSSERLHTVPDEKGRVEEMFERINLTSLDSLSSMRPDFAQPNQADILGVFVAGWADPGLHPETFWLGYATGPAVAWHRQLSPAPQELESSFYNLFYGFGATNMGRLYQLMSEQAQFWEDSWETGASAARTPIWGDSHGPFETPRPARDQYLPSLPVPAAGLLHVDHDWRLENQKRLALVNHFQEQNDELLNLLRVNIGRVAFNRYNLEVYLSIAGLYRQNLMMIQNFGRIADALEAAEAAASRVNAPTAVASLDRAIAIAAEIRERRNEAFHNVTHTWYKTWFPRVAEANGRRYLDKVDDVKDHQPVRTVDMSYVIYRELLFQLGDWANRVIAVRNSYAAAHQLPVHQLTFDWKDTSLRRPEVN